MIVRDARGSLVHVRRRDDGECVGCIEVGLYEIVRAVIVAEEGTAPGATNEGRVSTTRRPVMMVPAGRDERDERYDNGA